VKWKNFLSTGNQFTEIQLDRNNTTLIIGENGAGKSTILDALCFGLFGKPFRSINKAQLINTVNGGSCEVEVSGFEMYKGHKAEGKFEKKLFRRFETVFSGHFHHKSDDGQIFYLGTPYELFWNDFQDPKGFHIFDTGTRELERIVNPYTLFEKIYYDDTEHDYTKHDVSKYKEKYVKLIVVNKKDLYQFDLFTDRLLMADAHEVKIIEDFSELDAKNVSDEIVENTEDTITLLERYIDELDITLDKKRLKNTMKSLYNEAQDLEL